MFNGAKTFVDYTYSNGTVISNSASPGAVNLVGKTLTFINLSTFLTFNNITLSNNPGSTLLA